MGRRKLALLILLTVSTGLASAGGGPSTFGFDASSACNKPLSRSGRASLDNLPCDFSRESWCTIAGNAYPWQAVRRFVQENQGLMKRMYGEEKHISVLKTEFDKNDIELEIENGHNNLYSDVSSSLFRQFPLEDDLEDYEYEQELSADDEPELKSATNREYLGRVLSSGTSSNFNKQIPEEAASRPHSYPNETPSTSTSADLTTSNTTTTSRTGITPKTSNLPSSTTFRSTHRTRISPVTTSSTRLPGVSTKDAPPRTSNPLISTTTASTTTKTTAMPVVSLAQIANIQNLSINEIHGQIDRLDVDVDELTEIPETLGDATIQPATSLEDTDGDKGDADDLEVADNAEASESQQHHVFRPRPEYRPSEAAKPEVAKPEATGGSMEGQLFQDVAAKEKQEPPVLKVRGINACPVKEEVVAPFWANTTRGEVLALLNLYPFEQYVHWEKCTHENKKMYCRDGCRCEQQYRLHRLLAYDPNNECRGIFSDWFKFPSCCICRCYDLPLEFRVTSRSPRLVQQQQQRRIKVRSPAAPPYAHRQVTKRQRQSYYN